MRAAARSVIWALLASCAAAFIVPEELVSFLSIVYSNIPPIRKGTDSRVGLGFRFGPHADAQIVLELGPQTNTRALAAAGPSFGPAAAADSRKRHTLLEPGVQDSLDNNSAGPSAPMAAGDWLSTWRTSVGARKPVLDDDLVNQADLSAPGPINVPDPTRLSGAPLVSHLRKLYRKADVKEQQQQQQVQVQEQQQVQVQEQEQKQQQEQQQKQQQQQQQKQQQQQQKLLLQRQLQRFSDIGSPSEHKLPSFILPLPVSKPSKRTKVKPATGSKLSFWQRLQQQQQQQQRIQTTTKDLSDVSLD